MALITYHTMKKTYFYNFYPTKAEEEAAGAGAGAGAGAATRPNQSTISTHRRQRMLVEMRDVHPPPVLDPHNPWQIKKALGHYEIASGKIVVSFHDAFEHILRYWNFCMANHITTLGHRVAVIVLDVTGEKNPRKYEGNDVYFQTTPSENCVLACAELMRNRNLKVDDYIGLQWDATESKFHFKLFYSR